jgi:hypothetical protein
MACTVKSPLGARCLPRRMLTSSAGRSRLAQVGVYEEMGRHCRAGNADDCGGLRVDRHCGREPPVLRRCSAGPRRSALHLLLPELARAVIPRSAKNVSRHGADHRGQAGNDSRGRPATSIRRALQPGAVPCALSTQTLRSEFFLSDLVHPFFADRNPCRPECLHLRARTADSVRVG